MAKNVYFVLCEDVKGSTAWDSYSGAHGTLDAALAAAEYDWRHLTHREKKKCVISVCHAPVSDDVAIEDAFNAICESGDGWYIDREFKLE
jgi:hypothetical protein